MELAVDVDAKDFMYEEKMRLGGSQTSMPTFALQILLPKIYE